LRAQLDSDDILTVNANKRSPQLHIAKPAMNLGLSAVLCKPKTRHMTASFHCSNFFGHTFLARPLLALMQSWLMLGEAILLEVAGTTSMKLSQRFTRVLPTVLIFVFYACLFVALTLALKRLDLSVV
jgi:hypothetical protein